MKFGRFSLAEAAGIVLAHGMKVGGRTFRKGRVLSAADLELLEREGLDSVIGARIDATDVAEDMAALAAARALAGPGARVGAPFTGRCNVFASTDGLFLVRAPDVDRFNGTGEAPHRRHAAGAAGGPRGRDAGDGQGDPVRGSR